MWCEQCQSDVATEISADGQKLLCTTCHHPVQQVVAPSLHPETKNARDFLERWAREQRALKANPEPSAAPPLASPPSSPAQPPAPVPAEPELPVAEDQSAAESHPSEPTAGSKKWRVDGQHDAPEGPVPPRRDRPRRPHHLTKVSTGAESAADETPAPPVAAEESPIKASSRRLRVDPHEEMAHGPHFDVRQLAPQKSSFPGRSETIWGQLLAYAGVGLLTMGTVFVLWGYFGELEQYASTGWLMSTAGQMLLLLGIVTLVGGGMQQTTHEVSQRIEHLGGRIIRIEESTDKILKGPHFRRSRRRSRRPAAEDREAA